MLDDEDDDPNVDEHDNDETSDPDGDDDPDDDLDDDDPDFEDDDREDVVTPVGVVAGIGIHPARGGASQALTARGWKATTPLIQRRAQGGATFSMP